MKYKNKDGISLNYTQRNNIHTDLVKEVILEAIYKLENIGQELCGVDETIDFLKENFDIKITEDYIDG